MKTKERHIACVALVVVVAAAQYETSREISNSCAKVFVTPDV